MTVQKIQVAIIGAGIGREHLAGYLALPDRYQVSILCDLDRSRAEEVAAGHTIDQAIGEAIDQAIDIETDFDQVLANETIDLIDICLPPHLHFDAVIAALSAGKQVVCEKPLVTSLREADAIIEAAGQAKRSVFPVFQYRYGKAMTQLQSLIKAGIAGVPYVASLETHWNRGAEYYAVPWRGTWQGESGGAVLGHAIHSHDLLTTVFGPIQSVFASTATRVNDIETEDCASVLLQMQNGAVATSSITLGAASDTSRLRFCFEGLTAESGNSPYAPMTDCWSFIAREPRAQADIDEVLSQIPDVWSGFSGFLESVANSFDNRLYDNKPSAVEPSPVYSNQVVTLEQARHSIELVSAIYHSAKTNSSVSLPLDRQHLYYDGWMPTR